MVQEQEAELSRTSASSQISSLSTSFDGSSSSFIRETGNPTLDKGSLRLTCPLLNGNVDLLEVAEYFDCEIEPPEEENIFVVIIKLPYYGQHNWLREFCFLRVRAHLKEDTYRAEYDLAKV